MREVYSVKYRQPGQVFWRRLKNVIGDGVEPGAFRWIRLEDERMVFLSNDAEIIFCPRRFTVIKNRQSREAGQPVQQA